MKEPLTFYVLHDLGAYLDRFVCKINYAYPLLYGYQFKT